MVSVLARRAGVASLGLDAHARLVKHRLRGGAGWQTDPQKVAAARSFESAALGECGAQRSHRRSQPFGVDLLELGKQTLDVSEGDGARNHR